MSNGGNGSSNFVSSSDEFWKLCSQKELQQSSGNIRTEDIQDNADTLDFLNLSNKFWNIHNISHSDLDSYTSLEYKRKHILTKLSDEERDQVGYIDQYNSSEQILVNYMNDYPSINHKYGGTLPLTRLNQYEIVNVQSSYLWRTTPHCLPCRKPSYNKLCVILQDKTNSDEK